MDLPIGGSVVEWNSHHPQILLHHDPTRTVFPDPGIGDRFAEHRRHTGMFLPRFS